ncbi:YicC/YloC family endoribonuclease [Sporolituus thermophilus]|nr:YicC/YloC family endoribonuclease [Sporolituus thermophilus]
MTGFGRGEYIDSNHRFTVEIKAVNHRYTEIGIRAPKNLGALEDKIRRSIAQALSRGRVDIYIAMEEFGEQQRMVRVDKELAMAYHNAMRELAGLLNSSAVDFTSLIARFPDVLKVEEKEQDVLKLWPKLAEAMDAAIGNLLAMRLAEGANIQADLTTRIAKIESYVQQLEERMPVVLEEYRAKLLARMRDALTAIGAEPDETRLLQEVACFADRTNIAEELVRLKSHLAQFRSTLDADEAVGRKLDFIVQEINRETNTIASKANDFAVANIVVEIKSEIEKVREQIQNIE